MSAMIDEAARRLIAIQKELEAQLAKPLNEADTRFKVLDRFLIEVLGWRTENIDTEKSAADGFVDYTLKSPDGRALSIIEAKRVGKLAAGTASNKTSDLALKGSVLKHMLGAVRQAVGYASLHSVPFACVTDGRGWLFFQTNRRDGTGLLDGKGIFFPSLAAVIADFPRFHDLLSPEGITNRLALVQLNKAEGLVTAGEEQQAIVSPPENAIMHERNDLSRDASLLFSQFFSTITSDSDPAMLTACFVETPESNKADLELQKIAQKLLNGIVSLDTSASSALQQEIEVAVTAMQSEIILLVGNKASGKSTFITRFFTRILSNELRRSCLILKVGLERYTDNDHERLPAWAIRELRDQAELALCGGKRATYDELRGVFWAEYNRQKDGALQPLYKRDPEGFRIQFGEFLERMRENEPEKYLHAFLQRAVHAEKRLPCIVFDNADEFSPSVQDAIFQLANSLAVISPVMNIVPITDRTVWRLSKQGALQSYNSKSFYLPVPEAKLILQKRIDYVKNKLNQEEDFAKKYFSSRGFRVTIDNIDRFAQAVERIFVDNDFVSGLIGRLANFNIRRMLKIAERIFLSPEIRIDEVLKGSFGYQPGPSEILRIHRAIIKGEYDRYSPQENEFVDNLFWTDPTSPASPLLAYYLLWTLKQRLKMARSGSVDSRHWTAGELAQFFEAAGARQEQTLVIAQRLKERVLVETLDPNVTTVALGDRLAITEAGVAHLDLISSSHVYIEQMALSTGINNNSVYREIKQEKDRATGKSFEALRRLFADYIFEMDASRLSFPTSKEYDSLRDARKYFRGLGNTLIAQPPTSVPYHPTRSAPSQSVGSTFRRKHP